MARIIGGIGTSHVPTIGVAYDKGKQEDPAHECRRKCRRRNEYIEDSENAMAKAGLTEQEIEMVRRLDWIGLIRYGANFFVVEKFARVVKTPNLVVYARMRGESFEDFMQTRQVPSMR